MGVYLADRPLKSRRDDYAPEATQVQAVYRACRTRGKGTRLPCDSGISNHPDFNKNKNKSRILAAVDFTGSTRTGDAYGHGTGVASVAAGDGAASKGYAENYAGVAPEANLVDLRVIDENGIGRTSSTLNAINWAIANKDRFNIRVMN